MPILPDFILLRTGEAIPIGSLEFATSRSGGPGGQNVNKVETRVEVRLQIEGAVSLGERTQARLLEKLANRIDNAGGLRIASSTERTQLGNRRAVVTRLERILNAALEPEKKRVATRPTRASVRRRLEAKREHAEKKERRRGQG